MKKLLSKNKVKVGFKPVVGATRYTIKNGNKTKVIDVMGEKNESKVI